MPQPAIRCPRCEATWTGLSVCHCSACHRTFSGIGLFDKHRRRDACVDPAEMPGELRLVDEIWRYPERDVASLPGR